MRIERKYSILSKFEINFRSFDYKLNEVPIWPILKQMILLGIEKDWNKTPKNSAFSIVEKAFQKGSSFFNFFVFNFFKLLFSSFEIIIILLGFKTYDLIFLTATNAKRVKKLNKYYDVFCDPIIEELIKDRSFKNFLILETSNDYNLKKPEYSKALNFQLIIHFFQFIGFFLTFFQLLFFKPKSIDIVNISNEFFEKEIADFKPNTPFSVLFAINNIKLLSLFFTFILKKVQPKYAFVVCYYGPQGMAYSTACKKEGVYCIDIQHGVQGAFHYGYSNWENITKETLSVFPNEFWVWSEEEKVNIKKWTKNLEINVNITGNLFLDSIVNDQPSEELRQLKIEQATENKIILLLSLDEIPILTNLMKELMTYEKCFWLIRFHPRTLKKHILQIKQLTACYNNVNIKLANYCRLDELLKISNFHLTDMSSVVIEASKFNTPSIIMSELGRKYYHDYITRKIAFYANNVSDILNILNNYNKIVSLKNKKEDNKINIIKYLKH